MPNMTLSEALAEGLKVTGVGLIIVFSVLIILMLVMMAMKVVFYKEDKPAQKKPEVKVEKPAPVVQTADDSELIAVISAAVAACMDVPVSSINIKSYKKVGAWNKAGVRDIIDSRL